MADFPLFCNCIHWYLLSWDLTAISNFIGSEHLTRDVFSPILFGKGEHENCINYWAYRESSYKFCFAWLYLLSQQTFPPYLISIWLISGSRVINRCSLWLLCRSWRRNMGITWKSIGNAEFQASLQTYWNRPAFSQVPGYWYIEAQN